MYKELQPEVIIRVSGLPLVIRRVIVPTGMAVTPSSKIHSTVRPFKSDVTDILNCEV